MSDHRPPAAGDRSASTPPAEAPRRPQGEDATRTPQAPVQRRGQDERSGERPDPAPQTSQTPEPPEAPEAPAPTWRGPVAAIVVVALLAGALGYGAASFWQQRKHAQHTVQSDLSGVGQDLSVAVGSMRRASYEITEKDVEAWLRDPAAYGSDLRLAVLSADDETVTVAGYERWRWFDSHLGVTHTAHACARISLVPGDKAPVSWGAVDCPDGTAGDAPPAAGHARAGLLARTTERARVRRERSGASDALFTLPAPTKPVGDLTRSSVDLMCAPGTTDIGTNDAYISGRKIPIRLCSVDDLPSSSETSTPGNKFFLKGAAGHAIVNARVSGAIVALVKDAAAQGIRLKANSSFRTMAQQQDTCVHDLSGGCEKGDYTYVAQPGYSNHQAGAAVDFTGTSVAGKDVCDSTRAKDPKSRVWRFLNSDALRFGFRQYAPESWHWDVMSGADRCDPL